MTAFSSSMAIWTVNDAPAARQPAGSYLFTDGLKSETWQKFRERLSPEIDYDIVIKDEMNRSRTRIRSLSQPIATS